jgi:hypothetical protein
MSRKADIKRVDCFKAVTSAAVSERVNKQNMQTNVCRKYQRGYIPRRYDFI